MRYLIYTIIIILNFVLTKDFFGHFTFAGAIPNLNLLLVIITASESEKLDFLFIAVVAGIITDIGFGLPIGTFSLSFLLTGFLVYYLFHGPSSLSLSWKNFGIVSVAGVIFTYLWTVAFSKLALVMGVLPFAFSFSQLASQIFFIVLYNLALAFPMFLLYVHTVSNIDSRKAKKSQYIS